MPMKDCRTATVFLCIITFLTAVGAAPPKRDGEASTSQNRVLAEVNGEAITALEVDIFLSDMAQEYGRELGLLTPVDLEEARQEQRKALDHLIDQKLLIQEAKGMEEKDERFKAMVEFYLKRQMEKYKEELGLAKFQKIQARRNRSIRQRRETVRDGVRIYLYLEQMVYPQVHVRPREIQAYYETHREDYQKTYELRFRHIWFHKDDYGSEAAAKENAEAVRRKLLKGEDFVTLWKEYSYDRFFEQDEPGLQAPRQYESVAEDKLRKMLKEMDEGGISEVMPWANGWRVILLERKPRTEVTPFKDVQVKIHRTLMARKRQEAFNEHIKKLREKTFVRYFLQ